MTLRDINHWANLMPPLAPSQADVSIYQSLIVGKSVLLLGSTEALLKYSTVAIDECPLFEQVKKGKWEYVRGYFNTVLADGSLCFSKELTGTLLSKFSTQCDRLIARVFNYKLPGMKYAAYFPHENDFEFPPSSILTFEDYSFYTWDFKERIIA